MTKSKIELPELKTAQKLGLDGLFLAFKDSGTYQLAFETKKGRFWFRSRRSDSVKHFKSLDAVHSICQLFPEWELKVLGELNLTAYN